MFDESPLFGALVDGAFTDQASSLSVLPLQPELGVHLNPGNSSSWLYSRQRTGRRPRRSEYFHLPTVGPQLDQTI